MKRFLVRLAAWGDSDLRQRECEPLAGVPNGYKEADSLDEAKVLCAAYIKEHDLESSNWLGGAIHRNAPGIDLENTNPKALTAMGYKAFAKITYKGEVWPWENAYHELTPEQFDAHERATRTKPVQTRDEWVAGNIQHWEAEVVKSHALLHSLLLQMRNWSTDAVCWLGSGAIDTRKATALLDEIKKESDRAEIYQKLRADFENL